MWAPQNEIDGGNESLKNTSFEMKKGYDTGYLEGKGDMDRIRGNKLL